MYTKLQLEESNIPVRPRRWTDTSSAWLSSWPAFSWTRMLAKKREWMVVYPDQISPMQLWGTLGWHLAAILCSWSGVTVRGLLGRRRRPSALQVERRRLVFSMSRLSPTPTPPPDMRATVAFSTV